MKTKCKCSICGFELSGNAKWKVESEMWNHVEVNHKAEVSKFLEERNMIRDKIIKLQKSIPSLYSTECKGEVKRGSWTY